MKRISFLSLVLLILIMLTGCGGENSATDEISTSDEISTTEEAVEEDTIPPEIELTEEVLYCKAGEKIDYTKYVTVTDNIDEASKIIIDIDDSNADYENPGKYSVNIKASDSSENTSEKALNIYVYKDYTYEEMGTIVSDLVNNKFYDYKIYGSKDEDLNNEEESYQLSDSTVASDDPLGSGKTEIVGYIDYLVNMVGLDVYVTSNDLGIKNNSVSWNSDLVFNVVEITSDADIYEIGSMEILSKEGKI